MTSGITRRTVLASASAAVAGTVVGAAAADGTAYAAGGETYAAGGTDWTAVRRQFRLDPRWINLAAFFLSSHPEPVRHAIAYLSRQIDADPTRVDSLTLPDGPTGWDRVRTELAGYLGGAAEEYALTGNTTVGLGHVYNGIPLRPGQEFLLSDREHVAHLGAAILAADKHDGTVRTVPLFAAPENATVDEIVGRLQQEIRPATRAVGVTWVQSSTGVRMPVAAVADVVAEANRGRAAEDRCLLIVDGVHGLAAVDTDLPDLRADVVAAGTHKWLCGPRGTGLIWGRRDAWPYLRPAVTPIFREDSIANMTPGTFHAFEHMFALPAAVAFHRGIGRSAVAERVTELSAHLREGLAAMPHVALRTPLDPALGAGITCFDVDGLTGAQTADRLAERRIRISTSPNPPPYARIGTSIVNFPREIADTLSAIHDLRAP
ncbi:aminotransferase class V-fold PLP-dependent enzyme [Mangrovihabitans endophyticus]|uniref:Class V aminotransferase n=1 Tax=Mangrovihabitans endophyticus TaxID=1751298 RepID=A0A8J3BSB2_9ACTN|nr:aminotransferase class V-fold PLP-dependent enzyme [Mangrovihabitans endophyticus]GGK73081.1 class V aminotransferase [Mangrovihabitans endophyticus]